MRKMTMVFAVIALTLTLSTMALGQNRQRNQPGMQDGAESFRQQNKVAQRSSTKSISFNFDKMSKSAHRHRLTGAEGSHWPRLEPQAKMQKTNSNEFDKGYLPPNAARRESGTTTVNEGHNLTVNGGTGNDTIASYSKPQRNSLITSYCGAKARGKRGR